MEFYLFRLFCMDEDTHYQRLADRDRPDESFFTTEMGKEKPLVLVLLEWLQELVAFCCAVVAFPSVGLLQLTQPLVNAKILESEVDFSTLTYCLLWFPRWICATLGFLLPLLEMALLSWIGFRLSGTVLGVCLLLVSFPALSWGYFWLRKHLPQHLMPKPSRYWEGLLSAYFDLLAFLFFLGTLGLLIRLPFLKLLFPWQKRNTDAFTSRRVFIICNFAMSLLDWLALPWLCLAALLYRRPLRRAMSLLNTPINMASWAFNIEVRWHFVMQAFMGLSLVCFVVVSSALLALTPWRLFWFLPKQILKEVRTMTTTDPVTPFYMWVDKLPGILCEQLGQELADLFTIFCSLLLLVLPWRLPSLFRFLLRDWRRPDRQDRGFPEWRPFIWGFLGKVIRDSAYMILGLVVCCCPWRTYHLLRGVYRHHGTLPWITASALREVVCKEAEYALRDVPCYLAAILVLCVPWRGWFMLRAAYRLGKSASSKSHRDSVYKEFNKACRDLPYALLGLIVVCCPWRGWLLLSDVRMASKTPVRFGKLCRVAVTRQAYKAVRDAPFYVLGIIVACCPWRVWFLLREVKMAAKTPSPVLFGKLCRTAVTRQAYKAVRDVPFYILGVVTVCFPTRTYWLLSGVWRLWPRTKELRALVISQFKLIFRDLFDIPFYLLGTVIVLTFWRGPAYIEALRRHNNRYEARRLTLRTFSRWLLDILVLVPAIVVFICGLVAPWRLMSLCRRVAERMRAEFVDVLGPEEKEQLQRSHTLNEARIKAEAASNEASADTERKGEKGETEEDHRDKMHDIVTVSEIQQQGSNLGSDRDTATVSNKEWEAEDSRNGHLQIDHAKRDHESTNCEKSFPQLDEEKQAVSIVCVVKEDAGIMPLPRRWGQLGPFMKWHGSTHSDILHELFLLFIDLPFVVIFMMVCANPVRACMLWPRLKRSGSEWEARMLVFREVGYLFLDLPCLVMLLVLSVSWRLVETWRGLDCQCCYGGCESNNRQTEAAEASATEDTQHPRQANGQLKKPWNTNQRHILAQFFGFCMDLPYVVISPLCLWRFPQLLWLFFLLGFTAPQYIDQDDMLPSEVAGKQVLAIHRRKLVLQVLVLTVKDVPALILFVLLLPALPRSLFFSLPRFLRRHRARGLGRRQREQARQKSQLPLLQPHPTVLPMPISSGRRRTGSVEGSISSGDLQLFTTHSPDKVVEVELPSPHHLSPAPSKVFSPSVSFPASLSLPVNKQRTPPTPLPAQSEPDTAYTPPYPARTPPYPTDDSSLSVLEGKAASKPSAQSRSATILVRSRSGDSGDSEGKVPKRAQSATLLSASHLSSSPEVKDKRITLEKVKLMEPEQQVAGPADPSRQEEQGGQAEHGLETCIVCGSAQRTISGWCGDCSSWDGEVAYDLTISLHRLIAQEFLEMLWDLLTAPGVVYVCVLGGWRLRAVWWELGQNHVDRLGKRIAGPPINSDLFSDRMADGRIVWYAQAVMAFCDLLVALGALLVLLSWRNPTLFAQLRYDVEAENLRCPFSTPDGTFARLTIKWNTATIYRAVGVSLLLIVQDMLVGWQLLVIVASLFRLPHLIRTVRDLRMKYRAIGEYYRAREKELLPEAAGGTAGPKQMFLRAALVSADVSAATQLQPKELVGLVCGYYGDGSCEEDQLTQLQDSDPEHLFRDGLQTFCRVEGLHCSSRLVADVWHPVAKGSLRVLSGGSHRVLSDAEAAQNIPVCGGLFFHRYPLSLSLYYHVLWREFKCALFLAFPMFLRLPLTLMTRLLALPSVLLALFSVLGRPLYKDNAAFESRGSILFLSLQGLSIVFQAALFPVMIGVNLCVLLLPMLAASWQLCMSAGCFRQPVFIGQVLADLPIWVWIVQGLWTLLVMPKVWYLMGWFISRHIKFYRPVKALRWVFYTLVVKRLWVFNKYLWVLCIRFCYLHRSFKFIFLGEWLILPLFVAWSCWPLLAVLYCIFLRDPAASAQNLGIQIGLAIAAFVTAFLIYEAKLLIKMHWCTTEIGEAVLQLNRATIKFPGRGVILHLEGSKPLDFTFSRASLDLVGQEFWHSLDKITRPAVRLGILAARTTQLPLCVTPDYLNPAAFVRGTGLFSTDISFGTSASQLSPYLLRKRLRRLVKDGGDPELTMVVYYKQYKKQNGQSGSGVLLHVTVKASTILKAEEDETNVLGGGDVPVPASSDPLADEVSNNPHVAKGLDGVDLA
eukprot:gb/GEZN01000121.1/.p1 GENE.gb/GEZN01000121.1/~~gb/GEZN01000121.1/.p1  ORF type:complete len:2193 (+),score=168.94 gb/GEZN01000121.1/:33-6611(+)